MVFENLTLFELHMEGARIGPEFGGDDDEAAEDYEVEAEDAAGGPGVGPFVGLLFLAIGVAMAVRRFRARGEDAVADDAEQITIEAAAEA